MRPALLSLASFAALSVVFACSTFSAKDDEPAPPADAGPTGTDGGACTPVVVDDSAPATCDGASTLDSPLHCGACGHTCQDRKCIMGRCEAEQLTNPLEDVTTVDGDTVYAKVGDDVHRADLSKSPATFEPFAIVSTGTLRRMEVYGGSLYLSTANAQVLVDLQSRTQSVNGELQYVETQEPGGLFYPGVPSYYLYSPSNGGEILARIENGAAQYKVGKTFRPIVRSGADIFWTEPLANGANIYGPWDKAEEPLVKVGAAVESFGIEGETAYLATGGSLVRAARGGNIAKLATEAGAGVAFAISGNDLFYAVRRETPGTIRHYVLRVDKCTGGRPLVLFDINVAVRDLWVRNDFVYANTESGIFRFRR